MGQKVNPNGIRLGINRTWTSRWFSKNNYTKLLHEDLEIKNMSERNLRLQVYQRLLLKELLKN